MKSVATSNAPRAIGPYSQAVIAGNLVFCSGQIPLDPETMEIVGDTITEQTNRVFMNLAGLLEAAGSGLQKVVKTTVYLKDMSEFTAMNEEYARHFGDHRPARAAVEVARLPKDVRIEIDAIALTEQPGQGGGFGLVACTVFKTAGRCLRRLRWVRFPHAPATKTYGVSRTRVRRRFSVPGNLWGNLWVTVKTSGS